MSELIPDSALDEMIEGTEYRAYEPVGEGISKMVSVVPRLARELKAARAALRDGTSYLRGRANRDTDFDGDHDAADRLEACLPEHQGGGE
jgi:hypothetical protein